MQRAFGTRTRIWLTEYGYQTNPPDRLLGVSYATQARYDSEAALRPYLAPRVDLLIHYLVRDEPDPARWQSGLLTVSDLAKPSYAAFRFPFTERSRTGPRTVLWGQIRPGGRSSYRLEQFRAGSWHWVGGTYATTAHGFYTRAVRAAPARASASGRSRSTPSARSSPSRSHRHPDELAEQLLDARGVRVARWA